MRAPVGAVVRIHVDATPKGEARLRVGDVLRTPTGRCYVILDVRVQARGKHAGREHLACLIAREPEPGARVIPMAWHPRRRRKSRAA